MNKFRRNDDRPAQGPVTNERIRSNELRVTTHDGEALGIMSKQEALDLARKQDMDLILIVPKADSVSSSLHRLG